MFGLFNSNNKAIATVQFANLVLFSAAAWDLYKNPEAKLSNVGFDMLVHAVSILNLRDSGSKVGLIVGAYTLNWFSLGMLYSGCANPGIADVLTHVVTVPAALSSMSEKNRPESFM